MMDAVRVDPLLPPHPTIIKLLVLVGFRISTCSLEKHTYTHNKKGVFSVMGWGKSQKHNTLALLTTSPNHPFFFFFREVFVLRVPGFLVLSTPTKCTDGTDGWPHGAAE